MSGFNISRVIKKRLRIKLSEPEAEQVHGEIEKELGIEPTDDNCPLILASLRKKSDDELMELLKKIRKKKVIAGVA